RDFHVTGVQTCALPISSIYAVALRLEEAGLGDLIVEKLGLAEKARPADLSDWRASVEKLLSAKPPVRIALVGKYVELQDAYISEIGRASCRERVWMSWV